MGSFLAHCCFQSPLGAFPITGGGFRPLPHTVKASVGPAGNMILAGQGIPSVAWATERTVNSVVWGGGVAVFAISMVT